MADEVLIAQFRADVEGVKAQLDAYIKGLEAVKNKEKEVEKQTNATATTAEGAVKRRNVLVRQELAELAKLRDARKRAFTPEAIDNFNKKIDESKRRLASLRGETSQVSSTIKSALAGVAAGFGAAFSVGAVIAFGKQSVESFLEAEESANRLKFAITQIGSETEVTFDKLIKQSKDLQAVSIFSDESIQSAQTALATFGLTGDQIEKLVPKILDFASATKTDLTSATETFLRALEGQSRGLVTAGLKFEDTGTIIGNYNTILDATAKFTGATSEATQTLTGHLKQEENQVDELQEAIGEGLAPSLVKAKVAFLDFVKTILENQGIIKGIDPFQVQAENRRQAIIAEFEGSVKALTDAGVSLDEARQKVNDRLTERIKSEIGRKIGIAEFATEVALLKEEEEALKGINEQTEKNIENEKRMLTVEGLRVKQIDELNKLLKENKLGTDAIAKDNVTLINAELELRKKSALEAEKNKNIRIAGLDEEIKKIPILAAEYKDLLALISDADKQKLIELQITAGIDTQKFREEVAKLVAKQNEEIVIPVTLDPRSDLPNTFITGLEEAPKTITQIWLQENQKVLQDSIALADSLFALYQQFSQRRLDQIEQTKNAELEAIDARSEKSEEDFDKRRISERDFENTKKALELERSRAEKKAADDTARLKRKQFNIDKIATLAKITIETALKAMETYPFSAAAIIFGAAQAAIAAAQPNPYKKGTKRSKSGLALVGEEGPELMMLPDGAKIASAPRTKKYAKVIDTLVDNTFDQHYSFKGDITPRLAKQRKESDDSDRRSLAENITKSMVINQISNAKSDFYLEKIAKSGIYVKNLNDLKSDRISPYR